GEQKDNLLRFAIHDNLYKQFPDEEVGRSWQHSWMALCGAKVSGFDTSREAFLGTYGSYKEPAAVIAGKCFGSNAYGDNFCGSCQSDLELAAGEAKEIIVLFGIGDAWTTGKKTAQEFGNAERADQEFEKLKKNWHAKLGSFKAMTPDEDINHTVNVWGLYNCLITFAWSRAASLVYNGERDGLGYRDSVQDILGVAAAIPQEAEARLVRMISGQCQNGGAIPVISKDFNAGHEKAPKPEEFRSDDCQWFFNSIPCYVAETGDFDFYKKVVPYADGGEATVFEHLKQALLFNLERMGADGLPCGLLADWNDCLKLGYKGESLFVAFQLRLGLTTYADIARRLGKKEESDWALKERETLDKNIQKKCWDGKWFIWAVAEDGTVYGTHTMEEGQVYFNTQVWAVMSGAATSEQARECMKTVKEKLATPYGLMLCAPPFVKAPRQIMTSVVYNAGIKENAGIFNHTQGWGVIAETLMGNGDQAFEYSKASIPPAYNDKAEIRQSEPYVVGQTTYSTFSPRAGNTRVSWLSGAATWNYYSITQYILGIRPQYDALLLDPCVPAKWDGFKVERRWRGMNLNIEVKNPEHVCKGIVSIEVDGKTFESATVPVSELRDGSKIVAVMGKNAKDHDWQRL
ncbi:MAG: N,N'-diacetylchitobiose phosphorylase, partial [Treponema sp.]|nr:N,N'-diacetylchitobiose phosphorylase [Treponema sp.]